MGNLLCGSTPQETEELPAIADEAQHNPEDNKEWEPAAGDIIVCISDIKKTAKHKPIKEGDTYKITETRTPKLGEPTATIKSETSYQKPLNILQSEITSNFVRGSDEIFCVGDHLIVNTDFETSSVESKQLIANDKLEVIKIKHNGSLIVKQLFEKSYNPFASNKSKLWSQFQPIKRANAHYLDKAEESIHHVNEQLHDTWAGQSFLVIKELDIYIREPLDKKALKNEEKAHELSSNAPLIKHPSRKKIPTYSYLDIFAVHSVYNDKGFGKDYFIVFDTQTNHTYFLLASDVMDMEDQDYTHILKLNYHDNFEAEATFSESIAYKKRKSKRSQKSRKFQMSHSLSSKSSEEFEEEDKNSIYIGDELVFIKYTSKMDDQSKNPLLYFKRIKNTNKDITLSKKELQHYMLYISADKFVEFLKPHEEKVSHTRDCIPFLIAPSFNKNQKVQEHTLQAMMDTLEELDPKVTYKEFYTAADNVTAAKKMYQYIKGELDDAKLINVQKIHIEASQDYVLENLEKVLESMDEEEDFLYLIYYGCTDFNRTTQDHDLKMKGSGRPLEQSKIEDLLFKYDNKKVVALFDCDNYNYLHKLPLDLPKYGYQGAASKAFNYVAKALLNANIEINILFLEYSIVEELVEERIVKNFMEVKSEFDIKSKMMFHPYPRCDIQDHSHAYLGYIVYENDEYVKGKIEDLHHKIINKKNDDEEIIDFVRRSMKEEN